MAHRDAVSCDYCEDEAVFGVEESMFAEGWVVFITWDDSEDDTVEHEYCSRLCMIAAVS